MRRVALLTITVCISCIAAFAQSPAASVSSATLSAVSPIMDCAKLTAVEMNRQVGAKTFITSAVAVPDGTPAPYCRVNGYVEPMVKFEVRLPLTEWTQRFVQTGCGGLCGDLNIRLGNADGCYPAAHGELALASTDMGHSGGMDGKFGEEDYQLRIDFAYRGVHVTTLAAKALIAAYYGQPAKYSYFAGCSDGGREALMEAQRFPEDFNGITAGAPAMNFTTQNTFYHGWNALKNSGAGGRPILTADKLPILHKAVLDACDAADGLKDGLISEPLSCHFDPAAVQCKAGHDDGTCLSAAQVQAARNIYAGAHDAEGNKLVLSGPLPGSELAWQGVYVPAAGGARIMSSMISAGSLKNLVYEKNPPADYTLADLKFPPAALLELVALVEGKTISSSAAQQVFAEMFETGKAPAVIVQEKGLAQVSDTGAIEALCDEAIAANPNPVADYRAGKVAALNSLKGQVMKLSKGKANPAVVGEILERKLKGQG